MHPYFHPTTLLVLDDDPYYVESFKFHFGGQFPCVSYTQPERAIEHLLSQEAQRPSAANLALMATGEPSSERESAARGPSDQMRRLIGNANRFRRVSVLVVDYDMPSMTGVQVCRALRHLPVRKLLLTGKAGVDTAISAFNEGVIDTFLTKHDPDIETTLPRQIKRLQNEYFAATTEALGTAFRRGDAPFLADDGVTDVVNDLIKSRNVVEHYLYTHPNGVLLADHNGGVMMLVLADDETLRSQWEVARENGAPKELLEVMASRRVIPLFPTSTGYYERGMSAPWSGHLHPAQRIDGDRPWHSALVRAEQAPHIFPAGMTTFSAFEDLQAVRQQAN